MSSYLTYEQYQLWRAHPLSQFLLPPHQSVGYFISYSAVNFFLPIAINLLLATLVLLLSILVNKRSKGRYFEPAESYLAGAAILLSGSAWPVLLLMLGGVAFIGSVMNLLARRGRFSLYYFWLPVCVSAILISRIASL